MYLALSDMYIVEMGPNHFVRKLYAEIGVVVF